MGKFAFLLFLAGCIFGYLGGVIKVSLSAEDSFCAKNERLVLKDGGNKLHCIPK